MVTSGFLRAVIGQSLQWKFFFQASVCVMFATVPFANVSNKSIPESMWVGIAKGQGERRGNFCGYF